MAGEDGSNTRRFNKNSEEWSAATYYNVRSGEPCSITAGQSNKAHVIPVRSYRSVVNAYVNNSESKFNGPDGNQCPPGRAAFSRECMLRQGNTVTAGKRSSANSNRGRSIIRSSSSAGCMRTEGLWPTPKLFGS